MLKEAIIAGAMMFLFVALLVSLVLLVITTLVLITVQHGFLWGAGASMLSLSTYIGVMYGIDVYRGGA